MSKFKLFLMVAIGGALIAAAFGSAAALSVDNGVVQYGSDLDLTCTSQVAGSATTKGATDPTIDFASIGGLGSDCADQYIKIGFTGGGAPAEVYNGPVSGLFDCDGVAGGQQCIAVPAGSTWTATNLTDIHVTLYTP